MYRSFLSFFAMFGPVLAQVPDPQVPVQPAPSQLHAGLRDFPQPVPVARKDVTPELRGDILMARKMYREAVEFYEEAPETAVTLNKIGIAYHQMLDFDAAKKYYERSLKLNGKYAEAINNLGTIA